MIWKYPSWQNKKSNPQSLEHGTVPDTVCPTHRCFIKINMLRKKHHLPAQNLLTGAHLIANEIKGIFKWPTGSSASFLTPVPVVLYLTSFVVPRIFHVHQLWCFLSSLYLGFSSPRSLPSFLLSGLYWMPALQGASLHRSLSVFNLSSTDPSLLFFSLTFITI